MKRPWPFQHLGLKALSLALAVLLWLAVSGEETVERGLRVPLELQQAPGGLELTGEIPATVDVRVRGASGALSRIGPGDVVAVLDLHTTHAGTRLFPLTSDQVRAPFGIEVVQVTPSAIAMEFERSMTRQLPIVPAVDGRPAAGYVVGGKSADPMSVEVVGPESAVRRATEVLTEPVSVSGASSTVEQTVTLGLVDASLRLKDTRSARVKVEIVPGPQERVVRSRPVHLRNVGASLAAQATPPVVDVGVRGAQDALRRIASDDVAAYVDVGGLGPGQYSLDVRIDAPPDVGVTRIAPVSVQVVISSGKP